MPRLAGLINNTGPGSNVTLGGVTMTGFRFICLASLPRRDFFFTALSQGKLERASSTGSIRAQTYQ